MIVSNSRQFVFVHIFKTAGTSIKRAVRRYAMPSWHESANFVFKRIGVPQFGPPSRGDHVKACDLIGEIGRKQFDRLFSFAFVRNPWDWELSHFRHIRKHGSHPDHAEVSRLSGFADYVQWRCDGRFQTQESFLVHRGQTVVDFVGRFENLASDFGFVCQRLSIPFRLPKLNRTQQEDYRSAYEDRTRELVASTYASDINRFGYRFE
ncbi:sulfotransferase family 2 domain-containing protein [Mariniblastus fucicola]|uniref:Sulfotransferase family protein n=1 Tax=Mariniblastus fucicola TaxID=980251 RepID=A0A5B9PD34_9BACT|nr:sulfotransferase family 2 domain-containing protein [Mariniblastus fucicola]QEG24214.1 Sulfotransferase family protein [Mariniblastus fucicola]